MRLKKYILLGIGVMVGAGLLIASTGCGKKGQTTTNDVISEEKAKLIMLEKVPGATIVEFSYDKDGREIKYEGTLVKDNYEYEIDVNAKTGEIIQFEQEQKGNISVITTEQDTISSSYITEEQAKEIMLEKVPEATIVKFSYDKDKGEMKYEGTLVKDNVKYEIDVDRRTGEIIAFEQEYMNTNHTSNGVSSEAVPQEETTSSESSQAQQVGNNNASVSSENSAKQPSINSSATITEEEAKAIILSKVPNGNIVEFSYDVDDGRKQYEATVIKDNSKYELDVDAISGEIITFEQENLQFGQSSSNVGNMQNDTSSFIGESRAREIMLEKVPGGTFVTFKLDNDETPAYEGELIKDNVEYEITVDARTGTVIEFSQEPVGH